MVVGDFNAHITEVGTQKEDYNSKLLKSIVEINNLIILNLDDKCSGEITWSKNDLHSTIDYVLTNEDMLSKVDNMIIDDNKDIFDRSDHHMIKLQINTKIEIQPENQTKIINYLSYKEEDLLIK